MWWILVPAGLVLGAWLFGPIHIQLDTPAAKPPIGPFARNGQSIKERDLVVVNGIDPAFQTVRDVGGFPTDLGSFVPIGTHLDDTLTMRVVGITSNRGRQFLQASVDDPRINLQGVFDIPISTILSVV